MFFIAILVLVSLILSLCYASFVVLLFNPKKEVAWAISNATFGGDNEQTKYLVSQGFIRPLCDLLVCPDPRIVTVCLEGLDNILKAQSHDNTDIYEKAVMILETYWLENDEEAVADPPGRAAQPGFNFGGSEHPVPFGGFNFG
ncbi:hypothetical protein IFM89_039886 [Coptis chinensis]|uniref:Uncharacterized protein n=1 Tax=Coptis chinensis TaxID=261450 RepID=A0A835GTS6_9MAGN|nr:hypothetical protein IFM89_039886 [Coptis chinensis]